MDIHAARRDQRSLRDQHQYPTRKRRAVEMNDGAGKGRVNHSGEIIGPRKADENCGQHEPGHAGKKEMIVTASWGAGHNGKPIADCGSSHHCLLTKWID